VTVVPARKSVSTSVREIETPVGMARAHLWRPPHPCGAVVLGHGAGGSSWSADLQALTSLAGSGRAGSDLAGSDLAGSGLAGSGLAGSGLAGSGWLVVLVEQPWRVAGRKVAAPPGQLDVAWLAVMAALTSGRGRLPRPWVVGGRSAGARVACRTAEAVRADAVLAMSFPLHPPGRPERSRAGEARLVTDAGTMLAVIQGERDPFGSPEEVRTALGTGAEVVSARGTHSFTKTPTDVLAAASAFLSMLSPSGPSPGLSGRPVG
jgi:uncharacterized protein